MRIGLEILHAGEIAAIAMPRLSALGIARLRVRRLRSGYIFDLADSLELRLGPRLLVRCFHNHSQLP